MSERFRALPAVFIAIISDGQILLTRRRGTGFLDGFYDLPSGHVEANESLHLAAVRELNEETGLMTAEDNLALFHIGQADTNKPYIYFMFKANKWSGQPSIQEADKTDDVNFFSLRNLPKLVPHVKTALDHINEDLSFSFFTKDEFWKLANQS